MNTLFRLNNYFFEAMDEYTSNKAIFGIFILLIVANIYLFNSQGENMLIENQTILVSAIVIMIIVSIYVVFILSLSVLKILIENRFCRHLKLAIIHKKIHNIKNVKDLMRSHNINKHQVLMAIYRLQGQVMISKDQELSKYSALLESLIDVYDEQEAIENIPDSLLYTLNKVKPKVDTTDMKFLIIQLQEIFSTNTRKMQIQYIFTLLGFVVGLFGLFNATYNFI